MAHSARVPFRFLVAVRLSRLAEDRGARRAARPRRRLAADAARRGVQGRGHAAADEDSAEGRLHEARPSAQRALSRRRQFRMPSKFPIRDAGAGADRVVAEGDRSRRLRRRSSRRCIAPTSSTIATFPSPDVAADVAAEAGFDRDGARAAIDDPAIKDALKRDVDSGDRGRRVRFAVRFRRRRAVLGHRPFEQIERWLASGGF